MKSLNKNFLPVHEAGDVYTKEEVYTKDEVDALIEGGGGASGLVVNMTFESDAVTLDKNYSEISAALNDGAILTFIDHIDQDNGEMGHITATSYYVLTSISAQTIQGSTTYSVNLYDLTGEAPMNFVSDSETGELTYTM